MAVTAWKNIPVLRGISMIFVVLIHAEHFGTKNVITSFEVFSPRTEPLLFFTSISIGALAPFCLIAFLFASGFITYRMTVTWKTAWETAIKMIKKYLFWAVNLFLLLSILNNSLDIRYIIFGLLKGGPMSGYWFIVLIITLYVIAPLWIKLLNSKTKLTIGFIIFLTCLNFYFKYSGLIFRINPIFNNLIFRPLFFSPPFVFGMIFSKNVDSWLVLLSNKRKLIFVFTILSTILCISESMFIGYLNNWNPINYSNWLRTDRITLFIFSFNIIIYIITMDSRKTKLKKWVSDIGMKSLGILLLMDIFQKILNYLFWHVPNWIFNNDLTNFRNSIQPQWLTNFAIGTIPLYFTIGLLGPIILMSITRKNFGKIYNFLF